MALEINRKRRGGKDGDKDVKCRKRYNVRGDWELIWKGGGVCV